MDKFNDSRRRFVQFCPPEEMLIRAYSDDLGNPYREIVVEHLKGCRNCRAKVSAVRGLTDELDDLRCRAASTRDPAGRAENRIQGPETSLANSQTQWRPIHFAGNTQERSRTHLLANRTLILATIGEAPSYSRADFEIAFRRIDRSAQFLLEETGVEADDTTDLIEKLRYGCEDAATPIPVFLPAEFEWLLESFERGEGEWLAFVTGEAVPFHQRRFLTKHPGTDSNPAYHRAEVTYRESISLSNRLFNELGVSVSHQLSTSLAAVDRILRWDEADTLLPPNVPILIVASSGDLPIDDERLIQSGLGNLIQGP